MITIRISDKGQVTIPAAARRTLGLKARGRVSVEVREDGVFLRPVRSIEELYGIYHAYARPGVTWEEERDFMERAVAEYVARE